MPPGANLVLDGGPAFISSTSPPDHHPLSVPAYPSFSRIFLGVQARRLTTPQCRGSVGLLSVGKLALDDVGRVVTVRLPAAPGTT